jgi:parallel beta-helix repeat protein
MGKASKIVRQHSLTLIAACLGFTLLCTSPGFGQLVGPLSGTLSPGNYTVVGDIWVNAGQSLEIESPSTLSFTGPYNFSIFGQLVANGSAPDSILFVPDQGIQFWKGLKVAAPEENPSQLSYCRISGSDSSGIDCQNSEILLEHCALSGNSASGNGGGINLVAASAVLRYCLIQDNFAEQFGGGISCWNGTALLLEECVIDSNDAGNADGMGLYARSSDSVVRYSTISNQYRGGVRTDSSAVTFEECLFTGNASEAVLVENSSATFTGCTFTNNLFGIQVFWSDAAIEECTFSGNELAGLDVQFCSPTVTRCQITHNLGEGIRAVNSGFPDLTSCTISGNGSNGIYCYQGGVTIVNSIVSDNGGYGVVFDQTSEVTYCDFRDNTQGLYSGTPPPGFGQIVTVNANADSCDVYYNIFLDPEFVDTVHDDYRLQWDSPCIDAGNPDPLYNDPDNTTADMGAFFYDQSIPLRILLTPYGMPIEIPPGGGTFDYTIHVTNSGPLAINVDAWCDVTLPNGTFYGPVLGPVNFDLGSDVTISRERTQTVPGNAPAGTYAYNIYAAAGSDTSRDSFTFMKAESGEGDEPSGWFNSGESFVVRSAMNAATALAEKHLLLRSYPNPFNPSTVASFELRSAGSVDLSVYDIRGRQIAELIHGWREAGYHETIWDASHLPSGVFFITLITEDAEITEKAVLLK